MKDNDLDPFVNSYPYDLPSDIGEIIISKVFVVMRLYRLKGSNSVGDKGNFSNVETDLNEQVKQVCTVLPSLPTEIGSHSAEFLKHSFRK